MKSARCVPVALCLAAATTLAGELSAADLQALRQQATEALARGEYEAMAEACRRLAASLTVSVDAAAKEPAALVRLWTGHVDDCLALGHAHQLAGDWAQAVAAYQDALALLDTTLRAGLAADPPALAPRAQTNLIRQRAKLISVIGRVQREELGDLAGAIATLAKGTEFSPELRRPLDRLLSGYAERMPRDPRQDEPDRELFHRLYAPRATMAELATTLERAGRAREALETWNTAELCQMLHGRRGVSSANVFAMAELVAKLTPDEPLPPTPLLLVLSPAAPKHTLAMGDPRTRARAFCTPGDGMTHWQFALCPAPRREFDTLEFACDIEQMQVRFGGQFRCTARIPGKRLGGRVALGSIGWPRGRGPGREVVARTFRVPLGARLVTIEVGDWKDKFTVHAVTVKATFRDPEILPPDAPIHFFTEVATPGGTLLCNDMAIEPGGIRDGLDPGRYEFVYAVPGREDAFRSEVDLLHGGDYALFINLDSPLRWSLAPFRYLSQYPPSRPSLVRLPDGRWLAACGAGSKVMLSATEDGREWDEPWPLPHAKAFRSIEPSLFLDADGTVWLAYFGDRLFSLRDGGYHYNLWLTSSRDGRAWSRPRPVGAKGRHWRPRWGDFLRCSNGGHGAVCVLRGPADRYWMFWRGSVGSAEQMGDLRELHELDLPTRRTLLNPHAAVDDEGRLHLVLEASGHGLRYASSADGVTWTEPVSLPGGEEGRRACHPQLVLDREFAALVYEDTKGAYLRRGVLAPAPAFGPPVPITSHHVPLNGSRLCVTREGEVGLLIGLYSSWLLRADLRTLIAPPHGEF